MMAQPPDRLQKESEAWRARRDAECRAARTAAGPTTGTDRAVRRPRPEDYQYLSPQRAAGRGISS
jgi:exodeoxyribonuclease V alpha subunit